jgi:ArpU family phage transcriptional regulator
LFPEIRNSRRISELKVKQIEKTLDHILDKEERDIITMKFLTNERVKDSDVYHDLLLKKTYFYEKKQSAVKLIATALGII